MSHVFQFDDKSKDNRSRLMHSEHTRKSNMNEKYKRSKGVALPNIVTEKPKR